MDLFSREWHLRSLEDVKNAAHRQIGVRATDAYFLYLADAERLDRAKLQDLLLGVKCPAREVWRGSGTYLYRLASKHPEVTLEMAAIARDGEANERWQMCVLLGWPSARRFFDRSFLSAIMEVFLADRSDRIREYATQGVAMLNIKQHLPLLEQMAEHDPSDPVRCAAKFNADWLRKRFYVSWYDLARKSQVFVIETPEGEKWFEDPGWKDAETVARTLRRTHKRRKQIDWDSVPDLVQR